MRVKNSTHYDTRAIRKLITAAHNQWARDEGKRLWKWKRIWFEVRYTRTRCTSGYAYYNGYYSMLRAKRSGVSVGQFLNLIWHEIGHLYGYRHGQYGPYPTDDRQARMLKAAGFEAGDPLPTKGGAA